MWSVLCSLMVPLALAPATRPAPVVEDKIAMVALPFDLRDVQLLEGPFRDAARRHEQYLLSLDADRFLSGFRSEAGLPPKAPKYGGWESQGVAGQTLGHYLSGLALAYRSSGDERFRERVAYIVSELAACQEANGDGYVAATPEGKRIFAEVARGDIRTAGFDLNGGWVPWYVMHKVMAGLRDAYQLCGNEQAKQVLLGLGEWTLRLTDRLDDEQLQRMLVAEYGGMNEVAADLYALTGDERYLTLADRFYHRAVLDPLARREDRLEGLHANTQVPKLIGLARVHELRGDEAAREAARFFWETVVTRHSYVIGANSDGEHFGPPGKLSRRLSDHSAETCNTYNMLKLTRHLFAWSGEARYADYYERALVNHILASQHPQTTQVTYYVPLQYGARRHWQSLYDGFTCCVGTGMENHVKYPDSIYFHHDDTLWVNLFLASELTWREQGVKVRMDSRFPQEGPVRLTISTPQPRPLTLKLRRPAWADRFAVAINGTPHPTDAAAGSFVSITRTWNDGDVVAIDLPFGLRTEAMPDRANQVAVLNGPVVLAGEVPADAERPVVFVADDAADLLQSIVPAEPTGRFVTRDLGRPVDVPLLPFYEAYHQTYAVYFDVFTPTQWEQEEVKYRAEQERQRAMAARTVDSLAFEMQPERDHQLESHQSRVGQANGRKWRDATPGGWFEFNLAVDPSRPNELVCSYWGSEAIRREFDILVDGQRIATQVLHNDVPDSFFDVAYPIPVELTRGRETVRVRFVAREDSMAGGVFGVRMLRAEKPAN